MAHVYARPHHMLQTEEEVLDIVEDDPSTSTREIARQVKVNVSQHKDRTIQFLNVGVGPAFGKRHVQVILMFLLIAFSYAMRVNLSVAIVAMTDNSTSSNPDIPTYSWSDNSITLSSFYWGYVVLQVYAGKLGRTYGTKWFLVATMAINSTAFSLIPLLAELFGSKGVMFCRILQGLSQGFVYPSVFVLLGQWIPLPERSTLSTVTFSGLAISNVISMPLSGYICASWLGWPATFYLFGALGFAWILPWILFGSNSPAEHRTITDEERSYIQKTLNSEDIEVPPIPWRAILTSVPTWAFEIACCGKAWGFAILLTEMPTYINKIMKFDMNSNGMVSAAPYLLLFIVTFASGFVSDYITNSGMMSLTMSRKLFTTIGLIGPAISLSVLSYLPTTTTTASIFLLILSVGLGGAVSPGYPMNSIDLSPTFAGVLSGISNGSSNVFAILAPLFVQLIVTDETDAGQWKVVFLATTGVHVVINVIYVIFGSSEPEPWDPPGKESSGKAAEATDAERRKKISTVSIIRPTFGCRHVQMILYFLLMTYTYCMRTVLSVAIVAMNDNSTSTNTDIPTYNWDNQSVVLSAFFWGYVVLQLPAAQMGKKFGAKWLLVSCVSVDSIACLLIPLSAEYFGASGVMACRFFQGLSQGCISPLLHTLLGHWAPPTERSVIGTFSYAGSVVGNIVSLPVTGFICSSWVGWPIAFYFFGALGLKWAILWAILGADRPGCHKHISNCEKIYIESSLGHETHKVHHTPWKAILTSLPFWAVTFAFLGANWGSSVLLTQTPTYLNKILEYDIKSNSLLSAAPYLLMWVGSLSFGPFCDFLINNSIVSRGAARKIFNSIGSLFPALSLTLVGFIPKEKAGIAVTLLILNGGLSAGGFCGFQVNHMDLSPNHSGILMGLSNGSTSIFSIISPLIVQYIVTDQGDRSQWRTIFVTAACVYAITDLFYIFFASGEVQPWNEVEEEDEHIEQSPKECEDQRIGY
ncbi:hypothetical protein NQ317_013423 [Molorchus minor]|uniref:Major facilitator superfamily (MFS) profile domain-containing protein n=1 Tax=Molorchus minor TaxID=1323400 RepID=A0ABQ9JSW5_9CUCU|nr:hypothetical protein NQ317_013423 [Molorchus minor]